MFVWILSSPWAAWHVTLGNGVVGVVRCKDDDDFDSLCKGWQGCLTVETSAGFLNMSKKAETRANQNKGAANGSSPWYSKMMMHIVECELTGENVLKAVEPFCFCVCALFGQDRESSGAVNKNHEPHHMFQFNKQRLILRWAEPKQISSLPPFVICYAWMCVYYVVLCLSLSLSHKYNGDFMQDLIVFYSSPLLAISHMPWCYTLAFIVCIIDQAKKSDMSVYIKTRGETFEGGGVDQVILISAADQMTISCCAHKRRTINSVVETHSFKRI